ncbi:Siderophore-interacting protein [Pedobacter sp. BAL39]|uniref:siderophore-interacting protein n=1 Tax=Pedobacter sp. BAL39 TaxID=391596 RepID=UPI000155A2A3|nr:siderophore-interacting protein [Pedobacter sp. BAL39]EDM34297.1 Siderophore-interacting protein [Pedobacter sp. BAL39]
MKDVNISPGVIRGTLSLKRKQFLTPHYIRVVLTGADLPQFAHLTVGANNKIFIPAKAPEQHISRRTYTLRALDMEAAEMTIDFVAHGDEGPASAWAINAREGDQLEVAMKDKTSALYPAADWYLLAGDHTALPVISVMLETLPAEAKGIALIHVHDPEDMLPIKTNSQVEIKWIFGEPHNLDILLEAVTNVLIPSYSTRYIFTAAEAGVVRHLRNYFTEIGIRREELSAYGYWKKGVSEDQSQSERQQDRKTS